MFPCTGGKSLQRCGDVLRSNLRKMCRLLKRKTRKFIHIVAVLRGCLSNLPILNREKEVIQIWNPATNYTDDCEIITRPVRVFNQFGLSKEKGVFT